MMVAHEFGAKDYAKLDELTVSIPYPDATTAMLGGRSEIDAHSLASPAVLVHRTRQNPNIHRVANSTPTFSAI